MVNKHCLSSAELMWIDVARPIHCALKTKTAEAPDISDLHCVLPSTYLFFNC